MKYFKMVIRLGLLVAVSSAWMFLGILLAIMESFSAFINWLINVENDEPYYHTKCWLVRPYKWVIVG